MKEKLLCILFGLVLLISLTLVPAVTAVANDLSSSTIVFESQPGYTLTLEGGGIYSGVIPCKVDGGYDVYAKEGATAWFGNDSGGVTWDSLVIADHDAFLPNPTWDPDTPDWYQYSLYLYEDGGVQKWAIRNHAGATDIDPWYNDEVTYPARGVPMSGTMYWDDLYALETDVGEYLPGTGTPEIPGGAASKGGGAGYWDMDWSWGSEAVPLQYPGFDVTIDDLGGGDYRVTFTPAPASKSYLTAETPTITAISVEPGSIDFGTVYPGDTVDGPAINVENIGTVTVTVDAYLSPLTGTVFNYLKLGGLYSPAYAGTWDDKITGLVPSEVNALTTQLDIPVTYSAQGSENAQLIFEATAE